MSLEGYRSTCDNLVLLYDMPFANGEPILVFPCAAISKQLKGFYPSVLVLLLRTVALREPRKSIELNKLPLTAIESSFKPKERYS